MRGRNHIRSYVLYEILYKKNDILCYLGDLMLSMRSYVIYAILCYLCDLMLD